MNSASVRPYVYGQRPRDASIVLITVTLASTSVIGVLGLSGLSVDSPPGETAFLAVFSALPVVAGLRCGYSRLGFPTAIVSGVLPGVMFTLVATVGTALGVGSFGGGDSPVWVLGVAFGSVGFIWSVFGFAVGVAVALYRR